MQPCPLVRTRPALAAIALAAACSAAAPAGAFVWPNVPEQIARGLASGEPSERRAAVVASGLMEGS